MLLAFVCRLFFPLVVLVGIKAYSRSVTYIIVLENSLPTGSPLMAWTAARVRNWSESKETRGRGGPFITRPSFSAWAAFPKNEAESLWAGWLENELLKVFALVLPNLWSSNQYAPGTCMSHTVFLVSLYTTHSCFLFSKFSSQASNTAIVWTPWSEASIPIIQYII